MTVIKVQCKFCKVTLMSAPIEAIQDDIGVKVQHDCTERTMATNLEQPAFVVMVMTEKDKI